MKFKIKDLMIDVLSMPKDLPQKGGRPKGAVKLDCGDCSNCTGCTGCTGCTACSGCSDCTGCTACSGCTACTGCSSCTETNCGCTNACTYNMSQVTNAHETLEEGLSIYSNIEGKLREALAEIGKKKDELSRQIKNKKGKARGGRRR